jgi:hypothetical protein
MSNVFIPARLDCAPMLLDEILVSPVSLLKSHPGVVCQLGSNLLQLCLGDIVNCLASNECVLGKLLEQLFCFQCHQLVSLLVEGAVSPL